jgi:hypothetical protein
MEVRMVKLKQILPFCGKWFYSGLHMNVGIPNFWPIVSGCITMSLPWKAEPTKRGGWVWKKFLDLFAFFLKLKSSQEELSRQCIYSVLHIGIQTVRTHHFVLHCYYIAGCGSLLLLQGSPVTFLPSFIPSFLPLARHSSALEQHLLHKTKPELWFQNHDLHNASPKLARQHKECKNQ